jgi:cyanophycinase
MNDRIEILKRALIKMGKDTESNRLETTEDKVHPGPVIAIGGGEDKTYDSKILKRIFGLAGGKNIAITVIPWASKNKDAGEAYKKVFEHFGASSIFLLREKNRKEALDAFEKSSLIFFTGGDQKRLLDILEKLNLIDEIKRRNKNGVVIAGTSAGASILGEHMLYYSEKEERILYCKGINLVSNSIIDQHFSQRGRIKRLQDAVKRFDSVIGYGIDEDTAIGFQGGKEIFEIGSGRIKILPE